MPSIKSPLTAQEIKSLPPETQTLVISIINFYRELAAENLALHRRLDRLEAENDRLKQRLAQYEPDVLRETSKPGGSGNDNDRDSADKGGTAYSVEAEEQRQRTKARKRRKKKKSPGRRPTESKFADAERIESIYLADRPRKDCVLLRERAVWRLENGRAVLVGYRTYGPHGGPEPRIPGVTPRCEYGVEILVVLAFLTYVIGISLDKTCAVLSFFCHLQLSKSQADSLLRQLARHWEKEFDTLCKLLVEAAVVHMDETGWKKGKQPCSLWTFASERVRVFLFGCHKDAATLDRILPRKSFHGVGVSDNAAVYSLRFDRAQKCWPHLLRKAIRLAMLYPRKKKYRRFLDGLLALYRDAKRAAADKRLGLAGRERRVAVFEQRLEALCYPHWWETTADMTPPEREFANLANELMKLMEDNELFTFVFDPKVPSTNNLPERLHRGPALDRKAGRTSKSDAGTRRRSVILSVLESLRTGLKTFSLANVVAETMRWMTDGISLFDHWLQGHQPSTALNTS
jgi:transposase